MPLSDPNEERYDDILNRISKRRPFGQKRREVQPQKPHERALDRINAYDSMAELSRPVYERWQCYGPKALRGAAWAGVVVWAQRKGYHGYKFIDLYGAWAHYDDETIMLSIAARQLAYSAPVYDAGVYRVAIQNNFRIYYDDAGGPPDARAEQLYLHPYNDNERLTQRQTLREMVRHWRDEMAAN